MCISTLGTFASAAQRALRAPSAPRIFADNLRTDRKNQKEHLINCAAQASLSALSLPGATAEESATVWKNPSATLSRKTTVNTRAKRD